MSGYDYTDERDVLIDLETDYGLLEEVPAVASISVERRPAPAHPDGPSRGYETVASAWIESAKVGDLVLSRGQIADMIGADALARIEERIAEDMLMEEAA